MVSLSYTGPLVAWWWESLCFKYVSKRQGVQGPNGRSMTGSNPPLKRNEPWKWGINIQVPGIGYWDVTKTSGSKQKTTFLELSLLHGLHKTNPETITYLLKSWYTFHGREAPCSLSGQNPWIPFTHDQIGCLVGKADESSDVLRNVLMVQCTPRGWFQIFFLFSPLPGKMIQFDFNVVQMGWIHQLDSKVLTCWKNMKHLPSWERSHIPWKRKIIFPATFTWDMLVLWRVSIVKSS